MPEAARFNDIIKHSSKLLGFAAGVVVGALVGVAIIATGGAALGPIAVAGASMAAGAGLGLLGGVAGDVFSEIGGVRTGVLSLCTPSVRINGRDAAAIMDSGECFYPVVYQHYTQQITEGSGSVFIECRPASRKGDALLCDSKIASGSGNVIIGGPTVRIVGTEKTLFDKFTDYVSWGLVGVSIAMSPLVGLAVLGISSLGSYGLNELGSGAVGDFAFRTAVSSGGFMFGAGKVMVGNRQVTNSMYAAYLKRGNNLAQAMPSWIKNNRVAWALNRKHSPVVSKAGGGLFAGGLVVDGYRLWRDLERASQIPDSKHDVCCEDTSWLEPA